MARVRVSTETFGCFRQRFNDFSEVYIYQLRNYLRMKARLSENPNKRSASDAFPRAVPRSYIVDPVCLSLSTVGASSHSKGQEQVSLPRVSPQLVKSQAPSQPYIRRQIYLGSMPANSQASTTPSTSTGGRNRNGTSACVHPRPNGRPLQGSDVVRTSF